MIRTQLQQALVLQQIRHPDHTLVTYPNLGHAFYPSSQWSTGIGPIEPYVLTDLYSWLEAHSGFTSPAGSSVTTNATKSSVISNVVIPSSKCFV